MNVEPVLDVGIICGESPVWDADKGVLWLTDIPGRALHRFDPASEERTKWSMPEELCAFALRDGGGMVAAMRSGFAFLVPDSGQLDWIARPEAGKPDNRLNDGRCDRQGRFWAGSMHLPRTEHAGVLYRLDPDRECVAVADGAIVSNGLAWSPDSRVMYWSDSRSSTIYAFDFDHETGAAENRRIFFQTTVEQGRPDGATVDVEGFYWSACYMGGRVLRIAPDGMLDREIMMPVRDITMPAFGGDDLGTLYITTSMEALSEAERAESPLAGVVFAVDPGVCGLPEPKYAG